MAALKQIVVALIVLAVAAIAWLRFVPGASETLAGWGIDNSVVSAIAPARDAGSESAPQRGSERGGRQGGGNQGPVVAEAVGEATINDRLQAIGTGRSKASVVVKPYSSGRLTEILVSSGETIKAGDVLAKLDSDTESIAVDRARIAVEDAEATVERTNSLVRSNTASSVQLTQVQLALSNAKLALRDAELTLERRSIISPIAGVIGIIPVEVGNTVTADTTVATVDDRSSILVDFWVPERFANTIRVGDPLSATAVARANDVPDGKVVAVDSRVDEASRTLQVRAEIPNPDDTLRPGQSFQVSMRFAGDTYPAVDPLAVQWGTDGAFVWAVRDGKALRMPVRIIQRNTETVLVDAPLQQGEQVVTQGLHTVREGAPVQIAGQEPAAEGVVPAADAGTGRPRTTASEL